jgi:hypothetical protein
MKTKKHTLNEEIGSWGSGGGAMAGTDAGLGMNDETRQEIEDELARRADSAEIKGAGDELAQRDARKNLPASLHQAKDDPLKLKSLGFLDKHEELFNTIKQSLQGPEIFQPGERDEFERLAKALPGGEGGEGGEGDQELEDVIKAVVMTSYQMISKEPSDKEKAALVKTLLGQLLAPVAEQINIKASLFKIMKSKGIPLTNENLLKIKSILLESKNKSMFDVVNETERDMAETLGYLNEFLPFSKEKMNYDRPVKIRFVSDQANAGDVLGKTAHYNPSIDEIAVYVDERHPKDIMRSISHELVHHSQNCRGEFDGATTLGEQPYMQTSEHLNEMERQAYEVGNMTFRIWEDNYKHTQRENKKMSINEKTVRTAVKEALMKRIKEVVVREPGDTSPLTPEEIKLFLAASGHTGVEVAPPGVSGVDVEEVLPPGVTAADVAEMAPEEEEEELEEYQDPCAELGRGIMDPATGECVEEGIANESTDREWYKSALNESLIKRFIK